MTFGEKAATWLDERNATFAVVSALISVEVKAETWEVLKAAI